MVRNNQLSVDTTAMSKTKLVPFKATQFWNDTVEAFYSEVPRKRHMRQLKYYNNCFTARIAIDYLHEILKNNSTLMKEIVREQALRLLRKFLEAEIIEAVQTSMKQDELNDDNRLYRFVSERNLTDDVRCNAGETTIKSQSLRWSCGKPELSDDESSLSKRSESVRSRRHTETSAPIDTSGAWRQTFLTHLQQTFALETMEEIEKLITIKGDWITSNLSNINKAGIVDVPIEQDIPRLVQGAMTCLAARQRDPLKDPMDCQKFEKKLFETVVSYYDARQDLASENATRPRFNRRGFPLLSPEIDRFITRLASSEHCNTHEKEVEAVQLGLLLLPPSRRRSLQLLLNFMNNVAANPCLCELHVSLTTRDFVIQTFSPVIVTKLNENQEPDFLAAERFVSYLMSFYEKIMKIPEKLVQECREAEKRSFDFSNRNNNCAIIATPRSRSPSSEALKTIISGAKHKLPPQKLSEKLLKRKKNTRLFLEKQTLSIPNMRNLITLESSVGVLASETIDICCEMQRHSRKRSCESKFSQSDNQNGLRALFSRLRKNS